MELNFECGCGEMINEFTRGSQRKSDTRIRCTDCNAVYAITITQIEP